MIHVLFVFIFLILCFGCSDQTPRDHSLIRAPDLTVENSSDIYLTAVSIISGKITEDFGVLGENNSKTTGFAVISNEPQVAIKWREGWNDPFSIKAFDMRPFFNIYTGKIAKFKFEYTGKGNWNLKILGIDPVNQREKIVLTTIIGESSLTVK